MLWSGWFGMIFLQQVLFLPFSGHELNEVTVPAPDENMLKKEIVIHAIRITGNKVTRKNIILREVTIGPGDSLCHFELEQRMRTIRLNLLNTSLFHFVTVRHVKDEMERNIIEVTVEERWYTWPGPIFEMADRNFNTWLQTRDPERVNYGFFLYRDNFRGRKERVTFLIKNGYTRQFGIAYSVPYLDRRQKTGMNFMVSWSANREVNYASADNHQLFYKDPEHFVRREFVARWGVTYRPGIYNTLFAEAKFYAGSVEDTIPLLENDYFSGDLSTMQYLNASVGFRHDKRDNKAYPLRGRYLDLEIGQNGFGVLQSEEVNQTYAFASVRRYLQLAPRWFTAAMVKGKASTGKDVPYFLRRALGYRDLIRGYEYYVMDGTSFALGKTSVKFCLVKPKVKKLKFIPADKFNKFHYAVYLEAYGEAGYVDDPDSGASNNLNNSWQYSYGAGIHYVTYYDLTFRLEFSVNRMQEGGIFLNFFAPF
ncbi:MAG: BamA/TamA family outer membrane protein [Bacteroidia bacterium]|nr:BamA/TamA family outer membrane protein [Bacteroidia bacterium]